MTEEQKAWMLNNDFNEAGITYLICGDDTYSIKNKLKELGCHYDPILKWHTGSEIDLPAGYSLIPFSFDEIMRWSPEVKRGLYLADIKTIVERKILEASGPIVSEFYPAEIGDKIKNITAIYKKHKGFMSSMYGWQNIYTFDSGDYCLVWFTATELELELEQAVDLSGTIKAFEIFRGRKTTRLTRCKVIPVN
jgi:hypothetical protein